MGSAAVLGMGLADWPPPLRERKFPNFELTAEQIARYTERILNPCRH